MCCLTEPAQFNLPKRKYESTIHTSSLFYFLFSSKRVKNTREKCYFPRGNGFNSFVSFYTNNNNNKNSNRKTAAAKTIIIFVENNNFNNNKNKNNKIKNNYNNNN